jgi:soluble cytochrome b562
MNLTDKRQTVKDDLEHMKLEGLEAMTRKQVDDMERSLAHAEMKHEKAKESYDKVKKMLLDLQAGIEHLCGKLNEIVIDDPSGQV